MNDDPENCPLNGWRVSVKNEPMNELEEFEVMDSKWIENEIILVTLISGKIQVDLYKDVIFKVLQEFIHY